MSEEMVRLLMSEPRTDVRGVSYLVRIEGGLVLGRMRNPLSEGARELLEMGYDPERRMTTRRVGKLFDDWNPAKIRVAAKFMVVEGNERGLMLQAFKKFGRGGSDA